MKNEMRESLIECCKKHGEMLTEDVVEFAYDLINVAIKTSENKIDDAFLPIINATKPLILKYVDKIDGVEG